MFDRLEKLIGKDNLNRLHNKTVAVIGVGGVGGYVLETLVRNGIENIIIVDADTIDITNKNRQIIALDSSLNMKKVDAFEKRIKDINPDCKVNIIDGFYLEENSADFFENRYDYMADAVDTVQAKLSLAVESQRRGIPLISCMGTGNKLDPTLFRVSDITKTSVCPLCRVMRRELKVRGISHLKVVWSPEQPIKPNETAEVTSRRALPGSISFVPPVAGMIMAGEIIKDLIK